MIKVIYLFWLAEVCKIIGHNCTGLLLKILKYLVLRWPLVFVNLLILDWVEVMYVTVC